MASNGLTGEDDMADTKTPETDTDDPSLVVIHALGGLDLKEMSYVQLRRLSAALTQTGDKVTRETAARSITNSGDDTVRFSSPRFDHPR